MTDYLRLFCQFPQFSFESNAWLYCRKAIRWTGKLSLACLLPCAEPVLNPWIILDVFRYYSAQVLNRLLFCSTIISPLVLSHDSCHVQSDYSK